jgi:hypothetical protein
MNRLALMMATALVVINPTVAPAKTPVRTPAATADFAVGPQYDTTHVYVPAGDFDRFVTSFVATFGGTASKQGVFQVTPTPSQTISQLVLTPAGSISVFGFKTPIPYPFGAERTGYLVSDIDAAVIAARKAGAVRMLETFPDPIGRDVVVQWAGGVNMQLYWHTTKPNYAPLGTVPENRVYLTADAADSFIAQWTRFAHARKVSDARVSGAVIGRPDATIRQVRMESGYGKLTVLVSDGALPWPYGRDMTGYEVDNLDATLARAQGAGATVLVQPVSEGDRRSAIVQFPGGYIAEIHASAG